MTDLQIHIINLQKLINDQADDEGLWFEAEYISEAILQNALRAMHSAAESLLAQLYRASKGSTS